jgi:hypothetical protein
MAGTLPGTQAEQLPWQAGGGNFEGVWRGEESEANARINVPRDPHALAGALVKKVSVEAIQLLCRVLDKFVKSREVREQLGEHDG